MPSKADNVILTFPPRPISQWERALVAEWLAAAQRQDRDVAAAYVSERRGDDPMIVGRIVIVVRPSREPAYLVYSPAGSTVWVISSAPVWGQLRRFRSLRTALNAIRPALDTDDETSSSNAADSLAW